MMEHTRANAFETAFRPDRFCPTLTVQKILQIGGYPFWASTVFVLFSAKAYSFPTNALRQDVSRNNERSTVDLGLPD